MQRLNGQINIEIVLEKISIKPNKNVLKKVYIFR